MPLPEQAVSRAVVALGRALREEGLDAGVDGELALVRALGEIDLRRRNQVYWAARACLVRRVDDLAAFDAVFERFWLGRSLDEDGGGVVEHGESDPRMPASQHGGESLPQFRSENRSRSLLDDSSAHASSPLELPTAASEENGRDRRPGVLAAYSPDEALTERHPLAYGEDELAAVRRLAEELRRTVPERRSRRLKPARGGGRLDLRRTIQRSLETDGEVLRLQHEAPCRRPRRLVFFCDVSGSMERYSRTLLGSLQAAVGAGRKVEAFVFATRLTRLTQALSGHDVSRALEQARGAVVDWSGGTRIGGALSEFRRTYGRVGLARGAIFVVVSDGWDRGDPELLVNELAHLRLECRRLIWLNPRPADLDGQPLAVGMRAALPHIDDFVPGHDPRAILELVRSIAGVGDDRPARAQRVRLSRP
jgi:uncharacterized protein with von Willebrand factor type A (vWA) domain